MDSNRSTLPPSRRSFLRLSAAASAAMALRVVTEPMLARARPRDFPPDAVVIDANENPLGPCSSAREAMAAVLPQGGRYLDGLTDDLANQIAQMEGVKTDSIAVQAGSTELLHHTVCAFTSPQRSYVTADPGFEAGMFAAKAMGARVVQVPLTKSYAHDVKAMLAAGTDAGLFYVCVPNNPTGTLTSHSDIEYLVDNKPKGSIVLVDEAYIHFSDATSVVDLVKAGKDLILLRTFSKLYGMAGLRCGFALGRPDLLEKMYAYGGGNFMPITAMVAASASLKHDGLVPERKKVNADIREEVFQWLDRNGYSYVRSQSNCFMLDTKRPAKEAINAMAVQKVFIGRVWPAWPTYSRITVGTRPEMEQFQAAFKKLMTGAVTASVGPLGRKISLDEIMPRRVIS
jgi:histidinol-phosphate aminotransferase